MQVVFVGGGIGVNGAEYSFVATRCLDETGSQWTEIHSGFFYRPQKERGSKESRKT